jgi:hypothetical protein
LTESKKSGVDSESPSSKSQVERFKEAARELGADDDEDRFEERLKKLVKRQLTDDSESESMPSDGDES